MDTRPPGGIPRPNPADLLELDDVAVMCNDARTLIRGWFAAAHDRVSVWGLPPCPPARRPDPGRTSPGRGDRRPI